MSQDTWLHRVARIAFLWHLSATTVMMHVMSMPCSMTWNSKTCIDKDTMFKDQLIT